jgi:Protein kinase domain/Tetratricopeptide repeat
MDHDAKDERGPQPPGGPDGLIELAERIADGRPVDWTAELIDHPEQAELLQGLRLVARIEELGRGAGDGEAAAAELAGEGIDEAFTWGHLRVGRRLGEGGFGEVFLAFDPILRRRVALKLRRVEELPETDASQFLDEARRLARVRHPHVVAVHGADVHDGRAGLWADLVRGETLEEKLGAGGPLPESAALRIVSTLAEALAAVHGAGLVHGDLKAANVMLDEAGRVVLMDFSAASELRVDGGPAPARAASPLTAAPEVLRGAPPGPAADFYSLGVLLFRMLSGEQPIRAATVEELFAFHDDPSRPRPRLGGRGRRRSLGRLAEELLAADPAARPSGAEVRSRLRSIEEAPARRRRRWAVNAVIASLAAGAVASSAGYLRARRSEQSEKAAREEAEAVNAFLEQVLSAPRVSALGPRAQVSDLLDGAAERAERELAKLPEVAAKVYSWLADTEASLYHHERAEVLFRRALAASERGAVRDPLLHVDLRAGLGLVFEETGRADEALSLLSETIAEADGLAPGNRWRVLSRVYRSRALVDQGDFAAAMADLEAASALRQGAGDRDDVDLHLVRAEMAELYSKQGDFAAAEELLESELAFWLEVHGDHNDKPLVLRNQLATLLNRSGRPAEAEPLLRRNLEVEKEWLGGGTRYRFSALILLEDALWQQGRRENSLAMSGDILQEAERAYGSASDEYLTALGNYGVRLKESGELAEAEPVLRRTVALADEVLPAGNPARFIHRFNLAELLYQSGRPGEALEIADPDRELLRQALGSDHLLTIVVDGLAGACRVALGQRWEGEAILRATLARARAELGPDQPNTLEIQVYLARARRSAGGRDEGIALLADVLERRRRVLGAEHPATLETATELDLWRR